MTLFEMVGCAFILVGLVIGPMLGYCFGFGFWGIVGGGFLGAVLGWCVGVGVAHLLAFVMHRRDQKRDEGG